MVRRGYCGHAFDGLLGLSQVDSSDPNRPRTEYLLRDEQIAKVRQHGDRALLRETPNPRHTVSVDGVTDADLSQAEYEDNSEENFTPAPQGRPSAHT